MDVQMLPKTTNFFFFLLACVLVTQETLHILVVFVVLGLRFYVKYSLSLYYLGDFALL